ncbi:MAG: methylenetetrahydrofolate--tRNA-(uracil(54)-C(5))-methyltransferase (FADH(2)-oxidizing) TrmFO [Clostridiales bacterium]|nr:methylenetetrahydrofolate--tRNA-(uracil(54)-C(5))-methyltransferase (FADH(2)-oxidizing) TrmFO [Clostridiales bacterium]
MKNKEVIIIGAGLAGCEAALYLAKYGVKVKLYEMKSIKKTPAQKSESLAELVCSNSLKGEDYLSASGLLKLEMEKLGSHLIPLAKENRVPSGGALSVNREEFGKAVTNLIKNNENIELINEVVKKIDISKPCIVACGPLIDEDLFENLKQLIGETSCYFYDAIAPIVATDSIDMSRAYWGNRYNKGETADYLNCLMNKEEYLKFYNELINAKTVELHEFEKIKVFEGCMPVEVMAKRGVDALRYGPMKPVGLRDERYQERPYAAIQLRKENLLGNSLNMVGFQTNLTFPEQKRVFGLIPALKNAEFIRYGTMHRNSYINAPKILNEFSQIKLLPNIFIAGQLSGVEGYVESMASGLYVAINMLRFLNGKKLLSLPSTTVLGAIQNYIAFAPEKDFQPMNANYGIVQAENIRDKQQKKQKIFGESINQIDIFLKKLEED